MFCFSLWIYNKGDTQINDQTVNDGPDVAFGGKKMRGMGRFGNPWVVEGFTVIKWIFKQNIACQYPFEKHFIQTGPIVSCPSFNQPMVKIHVGFAKFFLED
ncbi:hypothetical protein ABIE66_005320 [Peribacillus sp. B2I2]